MSLYDDWMEIRNRGKNIFNLIKDEYEFAAGEGVEITWGAFPGVPVNGIQIICPEDTGGQVRTLIKVQVRIIQEVLKLYPATCPQYAVRVMWPYPVPMPASTPQDPPPPPIIIPPLPPTTPPSPNDKVYYV